MKRIYILLILFITIFSVSAQQANKAREILDKTAESYRQAGGISISFSGSQDGKLLLMKDKFHLITDDIETWFDGKTQWSYLKQNDEVNITTPTPEELQTINPYMLLSVYQQGFNYQYHGTTTRNGKQGDKVVLTPKNKQELQSITFEVSKNFEPLYICIKTSNGQKQEFIIHSFRSHLNLHDNAFQFNPKEHPHVEIIDLR